MSNLVVQTNVLALNSHRNIKVIGNQQSKASARLSSGYKINTAADDAAGLAISEKMRAQIRGLDMASKNTQDGNSLITTAEGGLSEIDNMVQRIRELAVQGANDTNDYSSNDRTKIQDEIDQLTAGIDTMAGQVEFNKKTLLDGSAMDNATKVSLLAEINAKLSSQYGLSIVVGTAYSVGNSNSAKYSNGAVNVGSGAASGSIGNLWVQSNSAALAATTVTITKNQGASDSFTVTMSQDTVAALATSDITGADTINKYLANVDGYITSLKQMKDNGADVASLLEKAGQAKESALTIYAANELSKALFRSADGLGGIQGTGLWFQTGANSAQGMQVGLGAMTTKALGIGDGKGGSTIRVNQEAGLGVSSNVDIIDNALQYVAAQRAKMGAIANRLEYTQKSLDVSSENLSAAESRIRDADMAKEMMSFTKANVLNQAGISMLAQANQAPQNILSLLR